MGQKQRGVIAGEFLSWHPHLHVPAPAGALARKSPLPFRIVTPSSPRRGIYISRERMDRSANARTERGAIPRTRTAAAEMHRAREKAVRGGRGTGTSAGAGSMYMYTTGRR
jgi:hypothetical protein